MDTGILEDLGLTPAEIKVYISLLELGSSGANLILLRSGLQNSVVHRALNSLMEKGIISFILEGKRKVYQATDPTHFFDFIEDKKLNFEKILPELKKRQRASKSETEATIYKSKRGISEIYSRLLNSGGKEYLTFGGGKTVTYEIMGEDWWNLLHAKRIAKKIPARQVFDETILDFGKELNKKPLSRVRFLSQKFEQLTETVIIGDYVAIAMFTENPYGVLIRDKTVADGYRKNFEILWQKAKR
ncbi:Sugar-specific transcriptional regulator TrmB [Candidatus Bilamarchaeum dharawalense]|uniref:Sugar-specific transcriptional regulator TrmB n=1 Tax=Candidatus Bilamarchaeum dharawalense TaxID=2885759 RepID=A0A5E4LXI3_9ARCH|nr:Sugar-specific transcriptional regulator TrmB [Candidatus Bilamarchaeum dharawalense]